MTVNSSAVQAVEALHEEAQRLEVALCRANVRIDYLNRKLSEKGDQASGVISRLQHAAQVLAKEATEAGYNAATYRHQGRKTRDKVKALRTQVTAQAKTIADQRATLVACGNTIESLQAEARQREEDLQAYRRQNHTLIRENRELRADIRQLVPGVDLTQHYTIRSSYSLHAQAFEVRAHGVNFHIADAMLRRISPHAIQAIAEGWAVKTAEGLVPLYAEAIEQAAKSY